MTKPKKQAPRRRKPAAKPRKAQSKPAKNPVEAPQEPRSHEVQASPVPSGGAMQNLAIWLICAFLGAVVAAIAIGLANLEL